MKKLIIISGSKRILKEPANSVPAIQRFNGILIRQLKKYYKQLRNIDVLILSPVYGLINAEEKIEYLEPIQGDWRNLKLNENEAAKLCESNLLKLQKIINSDEYDEIYINVGKNLLKTMGGFEKLLPNRIKITYAKGAGIGPKMAHMKKWIKSQI